MLVPPAAPSSNEPTIRGKKILFAVITEFIATGEPVGSRTLAKKYGLELSAASIRNVLADLEDGGLLQQPHTSAGRVPTDRALRMFVDAIGDASRLSIEEKGHLEARLAELYASTDDPRRETTRYLSEMVGGAAVVAPPRAEVRALSQVRFIRTRPNQLLAVLVFKDGSVENRFLTIAAAVPEQELVRIHNLLDDVIEGRSLREVRDLFARRLEGDRSELDALRRRAFELGRSATEPGEMLEARRSELVIEGQTKLFSLPEYAGDSARLARIVQALDEREAIVEILDQTISAGGVTVFVGSEAGELGAGGLSLVVAPYEEAGRATGTVGVIGPARMDYAKVMPLVETTAQALTEAFGREPHGRPTKG